MHGVRRGRRLLAGALVVAAVAGGACGDDGDGGDARVGAGPAQVDLEHPPDSVVLDESIGRAQTLRAQRERGGVLYRVHRRAGDDDEALSVTVDGLAVRVADTGVLRSTGDFTSWRLTPEGVQSLQLAIAGSGLLEVGNDEFGDGDPSLGESAAIWVGEGRVVEVHELGRRSGFTAEQLARRDRFRDLLARLTDHAWLGSRVTGPPQPWVPDTLSIQAAPAGASPGPPGGLGPVQRWPLDTGIRALARGSTEGPYGPELVVCLTGDQVPPVWRLQTGVNLAYLTVDDGERWELGVNLRYPGYRLLDDPCP